MYYEEKINFIALTQFDIVVNLLLYTNVIIYL